MQFTFYCHVIYDRVFQFYLNCLIIIFNYTGHHSAHANDIHASQASKQINEQPMHSRPRREAMKNSPADRNLQTAASRFYFDQKFAVWTLVVISLLISWKKFVLRSCTVCRGPSLFGRMRRCYFLLSIRPYTYIATRRNIHSFLVAMIERFHKQKGVYNQSQ